MFKSWRKRRTSGLGKQSARRGLSRVGRIEPLEDRRMMTLTLAPLSDIQVPPLASVPVVLQGADTFGGALNYAAVSANTDVVHVALASVADPVVKMSVAGYGDMTFLLYQDAAPNAVAQFLSRVNDHIYDGTQFYRVEPGFVIQGGVDGAGSGDKFDDEFLPGSLNGSAIPNLRFMTKGVLAMANSGPDTNTSEFFITDGSSRVLDFRYTIIGQLISGDDVREAIQNAPTTEDTVQKRNEPTTPITITSVSVSSSQSDVMLVSVLGVPADAQPVTVTVGVGNGKDPFVVQTFTVTPVADTDPYHNAPPYIPSTAVDMSTNSSATFNFPFIDIDFSIENTSRSANASLVSPPSGLTLDQTNFPILTVTASDNLCGVYGLALSIEEDAGSVALSRAADTQTIPILIRPTAPSRVTLLDGTGSSGNLTDNNNSAGQTLTFRVTGVSEKNVVNVYADGVLIGSATVADGQTTVDVATNGTKTLADGKHTITAKQVYTATNIVVGNYKEDSLALDSAASSGLEIGVRMGTGVGLYDPTKSRFYLNTRKGIGIADTTFDFGEPNAGWQAIAGDWNGDGVDTIGLYDPKTSKFYLKNSNSTGVADLHFGFGAPGANWKPVVGDWNGDGKDSPALYDSSRSILYIQNTNTTTIGTLAVYYGDAAPGALPIGGSWNGATTDGLGVFYASTAQFRLRNGVSDSSWAATFGYGAPNTNLKPVTSDWDQANGESVGVYDPATSFFYLRDSNTTGVGEYSFGFGEAGAGWQPIAGQWQGSLTTVNDSAPVLNDASATILHNVPAGTKVLTMAATDADVVDGGLSYSIIGGNIAGIFAIDPVTGVITVADAAKLQQQPASSPVLTVQVSDNGPGTPKTDTAAVTINILVNDNDPTLADATFSVAQGAANGTVITALAGADADSSNGGLSYTITAGNDLGIFGLVASGSDVQLVVADNTHLNDASAPSFVQLKIQVSDNGPVISRTHTATITVTVTGVNASAPVVTPATFSIPKASVTGTAVGTVTASDADSPSGELTYSITAGNAQGIFAIDPTTGAITVADGAKLTLSPSTKALLTVQASDNGPGTPKTGTATITVSLTGAPASELLSYKATTSDIDVVPAEGALTGDTSVTGHASYNISSVNSQSVDVSAALADVQPGNTITIFDNTTQAELISYVVDVVRTPAQIGNAYYLFSSNSGTTVAQTSGDNYTITIS